MAAHYSMTPDSLLNIARHGTPDVLPVPQWLVAGPAGALLDEGQLRGIFCGGREIVRRIYGAVRDRFWNTVPGDISGLKVEQSAAGFRVQFTSTHVSDEVDFVWLAEIVGSADGSVTYTFDGEARRDMAKNRIGLCVLLPLWLCGSAAEVDYVSGDRATVKFPQLVDPMQPVRGLHDFRRLEYAAGEGGRLVLEFEGDVFEIEDQRNWTDASFKAYSTPQRIPMPAQMRAGQRVRQTVRVIPAGASGAFVAPQEPAEVSISLGGAVGAWPGIGVGAASHGDALTAEETARLSALQLAHYRLEIDAAKDGWQALLARGLAEAAAMQTSAEVALFLSEDAEAAATEARAAAAVPGSVARWIMLTRGAPATRESTALAAGPILRAAGAAAGCGTDADFFQLNNNRPRAAACDFLSVPLRPCAHQFDRATIIENLDGQGEVLRSLAALYPDKPIAVSPVSFRTRAQKGPLPKPGELPGQADVRQMSLLGAAWTVGCLKAVAAGGAASVTLFQTTGLRGIMERAGGSDAPQHFHSTPGQLFPVYHVLAALAGWQGAETLEVRSGEAALVDGVALRKDGRTRLLLANYTAAPRKVSTGLSGTVQVLDATGMAAATLNDQLTLPPFGVAVIDVR
jgi:hypothetical protein